MMTTYTFLIMLIPFVFFGYRSAAGMTLVIFTFFKLMVYGDAVIENKTLTLPTTRLFGLLFQVF